MSNVSIYDFMDDLQREAIRSGDVDDETKAEWIDDAKEALRESEMMENDPYDKDKR